MTTRLAAVRLALIFVVAVLAACGGGDDNDADGGNGEATGTVATTKEAMPIADRVLVDGDLEGFSVGPAGEWATAQEFAPHYTLVGTEQLTARLSGAGFAAGAGNTLVGDDEPAKQAQSFAIQVRSPRVAAQVLEWVYGNAAAPCPPPCGVEALPFNVAIPGARGVELRAEEQTQFGPPFSAFRIFFADGPFFYTIATHGPPDSVERPSVVAAARALYERVEGSPPAG